LRNTDQTRRWAEGISFLVKYIDKPKITPQVEELSQYGKKRLIHTGVQYEPVTLRFHDSVSDGALHFWQDYFWWYFGDARGKTPLSWNYDATNIEMNRDAGGWGFNPTKDAAVGSTATNFFLTEMKLWQFWGGYFTAMSFINPKITSFDHDSNDYAEGAVGSEITMQMKYEGVIYHQEKSSIRLPPGRGGMTDEEKRAFLLDLGDYYNVPNIRQNSDLFSRMSGQVLQGVLDNVLRGNGANAGSVLKNVVMGQIPFTKSSINALKNQVFNNTISRIGSSALNVFGNYSFGTATDNRLPKYNEVYDPRLVSYKATNADAQAASAVSTRGKAGGTDKIIPGVDSFGMGGNTLAAATSAMQSENKSFLDSFGGSIASAARDVRDAVGSGVDWVGDQISSGASVVGSFFDSASEEGTRLADSGYAALNDMARSSTQYGTAIASDMGGMIAGQQQRDPRMADNPVISDPSKAFG
jgi:hypothetical protein